MTFTKRPLTAGATLGDRLRALRTETGWSVEDVGRRIHVTSKYLTAVEESRYRDLPGLVYARQFVRRYAEALETDVETAVGIFEQEYAVVAKTGPTARPLLTPRASTEFPWVRRHLRFIVSGIIVVIAVTYLGTQAVRNFLPPRLTVTQPATDISTSAVTLIISGTTDPNATVTINDQDVQTSGDGRFNESIDLHIGLNALKISAIKKHSRPRTVIRNILVESAVAPASTTNS
ncbi:MAG: helix-turn-helix domain-containing protein [Patescibacteria group bacterium]